jgi:nucleoside transporter
VLAVMCLLAGAAMFAAGFVARADGGSGEYQWLFIGMLLLHALCYAPTLGLTNTVAFHNMTRQEVMFPLIRVFGTIGWIVSGGWVVSKWLNWDSSLNQYFLTGAAAVVLGLFSFSLPHTPPPSKGKKIAVRDVLGLDALSLLKSRSYLVFMICSFLICIPLAAYYAYAQSFVEAAGFANPGFTMSFGQVAEIFFMLVMPLCFRALGVKWMLLVGMAAWVLRYGLFAAAAPTGIMPLIILGILLHGICFDFFFVTGFIYTDKKAGKAIRGQAQGFLVLVTQGLGMLIGAQVAGRIGNYVVSGTGEELLRSYQMFWLAPCIMAGIVMLAFMVLFRDDTKDQPEALPPGRGVDVIPTAEPATKD